MQLFGNLSPGPCYGWYDGRNHDNRLSAYWARTYQFTANVAPKEDGEYWDFQDLAVASGYNPQTANPDVTVETGTSWSVEGSGTAGYDKGGTASVGFSAGASFSNSASTTYAALETAATIGSNSSPAQAQWSYDSWNFVHASIEPGNNACPHGFWEDIAAPPIITTDTFSPQMTYVWEVSKTMRQTYTGTCTASCSGGGCSVPSTEEDACLPVDVDLGVLLGWAYFPVNDGDQCGQGGANYALNNNPDAQSTVSGISWEPLDPTNPKPTGLDSLYFDVSCSTSANYGTVPLGPAYAGDQNNSIGNPGTPYNLPLQLNIPFAPTSVTTTTTTQ